MNDSIATKEEIPASFTKEELEDFMKLYCKHFHILLTEEEAYLRANRIFRAVKASAKPIPESDKINSK